MNIECRACIDDRNGLANTEALEGGFQVVVGTPGCVNDMIEHLFLKTNLVEFFVLDEAVEMLSVRSIYFQVLWLSKLMKRKG